MSTIDMSSSNEVPPGLSSDFSGWLRVDTLYMPALRGGGALPGTAGFAGAKRGCPKGIPQGAGPLPSTRSTA